MNCIEELRPFQRAERLAQKECDATLDILLHLNEIESHELYLTHGYASMFDFATRHLRYSESAAGRRIQVARCLRRFPELVKLFRTREVNLSTVSHLSRVIDDESDEKLIERIRGKSQREVERIVAEVRPSTRVRDEVRPIGGPPPRQSVPGRVRQTRDITENGTRDILFDRSPVNRADASAHAPAAETVGDPGQTHELSRAGNDLDHRPGDNDRHGAPNPEEPRFKIQFSAGAEFKKKLDRVRSLLSGRFPRGVSLEGVFEAALEALLDRECPIRREERREARRSKQRDPAAEERRRRIETFSPDGAARKRWFPQSLRDAVHVRDGGRCTFVGTSGRRCSAKHDLEIDHIVPFALGGSSTPENLRLLCAKHNRLEAERVYGRSWMSRFRTQPPDSFEIASGNDS